MRGKNGSNGDGKVEIMTAVAAEEVIGLFLKRVQETEYLNLMMKKQEEERKGR